jgi:hypothetical protein
VAAMLRLVCGALAITLFAGGLLTSVAAEAQQAARIPRIGYLGGKTGCFKTPGPFSKDCAS